jgi:hypothetical protein
MHKMSNWKDKTIMRMKMSVKRVEGGRRMEVSSAEKNSMNENDTIIVLEVDTSL